MNYNDNSTLNISEDKEKHSMYLFCISTIIMSFEEGQHGLF